MKDFKGKELHEGDEVIFVLKRSGGKGEILLSEGVIKQFHAGNAYIQPKDAEYNWTTWGCKGKCIMKI
jgi:hypothetical protein